MASIPQKLPHSAEVVQKNHMNYSTEITNLYKNQVYTFLLVLLILTDIGFIIAHTFYYINADNIEYKYSSYRNLLHLEIDGSYPEFFQYLKFFWCGLISFSYSARTRQLGFVFLGVLFWYLLLDDLRKIHETVGGDISEMLSVEPLFGLRLQDYGELIYAAMVGIPVFAMFAILIAMSQGKIRYQFMMVAALIIMLGVFGVFVDLFHSAIGAISQNLRFTFGAIEDGGEMVVTSLILSYLYRIHAGLLR